MRNKLINKLSTNIPKPRQIKSRNKRWMAGRSVGWLMVYLSLNSEFVAGRQKNETIFDNTSLHPKKQKRGEHFLEIWVMMKMRLNLIRHDWLDGWLVGWMPQWLLFLDPLIFDNVIFFPVADIGNVVDIDDNDSDFVVDVVVVGSVNMQLHTYPHTYMCNF